jgi:hypothetical protein
MKLLVTTAHPTLYQHPGPDGEELHPNLGRLLQPRHTSSARESAFEGVPWAADNDCFNGLEEDRFRAMLDRLDGLPGCRFVTMPDVVRCVGCSATVDGYGGKPACSCGMKPRFVYGDAELTRRRFDDWAPVMADYDLPLGYVLQDGLENTEVPWDSIAAVFVGGSTEFKLGAVAREACEEAKRRGLWVHVGRVNTKRRFDIIAAWDCVDSFDGSKFARWRKTHLDTGLSWCFEQERQGVLELAA